MGILYAVNNKDANFVNIFIILKMTKIPQNAITRAKLYKI